MSDVWDIHYHVAHGIGRPPVWMVGPSVIGSWKPAPTPEAASKTIWIVDDGVQGEVRLSGRRLGGPEVAVFPLYERDHTFELNADGDYSRDWDRTELVLIPPHGRRRDGDHRTEVYIPSAGCWQFTAQVGTETVEIVLYRYEAEQPSGFSPLTTPGR